MNTDMLLKYLITAVFLFYAWRLGIKTPPYRSDKGFATRRAKENEETWAYVQKCAGVICLVMAVVLALAAYLIGRFLEGTMTGMWLQIGIEVACIAGLIPLVNLFTRIKFGK